MSELYDSYRLYFMLERKNERNNQFQHTSHPLSDGVLRARPQAGQFLPRAPGEELPLWSKLIPAVPVLWSNRGLYG